MRPLVLRWIWMRAGLLLLGAACTGWGGWFLHQSFTTRDWVTVQGEVLDTQVRSKLIRSRTAATGENRERRRRWYAEVRYAWEDQGQRHTGKRHALGEGFPLYRSRAEAEADAARHPAGAPITVYHHPTDPTQAVLDRNPSISAWVPLLLGMVLLLGMGVTEAVRRRARYLTAR